MPIKILDVEANAYNDADKAAVEAAALWLRRIQELFITERSHQKQIGISEVGSDCRKCVARKLAQKPKSISGGWFPFIGTAIHDALEKGFQARWPDEYDLEERLFVHQYKDLTLGGSCDMAYLGDGMLIVNDWKIVGERALRDADKGKTKQQYRVQAMLYGYGWKQLGHNVTHVAISYLPRDKDLPEAQVALLRYDEQVALDALAELERMIDVAEMVGWDKVIEKEPKASFCFDCKKFEQFEMSDVESLI